MAEVWFYHLERKSADAELPGLLIRGLERGLRMLVVTTTDERVKDLSLKLWAHEETGFLPHGFAGEPQPDKQPIYLCTDDVAPNAATFRFYVDGAAPASLEAMERAIILFDGNDEVAVQTARQHWKALKPLAEAIKYWKQDDEGRWRDQASA